MVGLIHLHQARVQAHRNKIVANRLQLFPVPVGQTTARIKLHQNVPTDIFTGPPQEALHLWRFFPNYEQGQESLPCPNGVVMSEIWKTLYGFDELYSQGPDAGVLGGRPRVDECLPVDCVGHHQQFVISWNDEFWVVVSSEPEE